ncbi:hypothetical protein EYF80_059879 [Liparis tanakae]|uniref:Uncharacterized protein n=1 Tax=Liparis tanakae TaxID=230148 RepID=A0A4Z2EN30_9TELE|nr:hypothetical protein EYF80_059879 [Liparis tanakae]
MENIETKEQTTWRRTSPQPLDLSSMNDFLWRLRTGDTSRHLVHQLLEVWKLLASQQPDTGLGLLDSLYVACRFQPVERIKRRLPSSRPSLGRRAFWKNNSRLTSIKQKK